MGQIQKKKNPYFKIRKQEYREMNEPTQGIQVERKGGREGRKKKKGKGKKETKQRGEKKKSKAYKGLR